MTITFDIDNRSVVMCRLEQAGAEIDEERVQQVLKLIEASFCEQFYDEVAYAISSTGSAI